MKTRRDIAVETAGLLAGARLDLLPSVLGFDGFVDEIIDVIETRRTPHDYLDYERVETIAAFAAKVGRAAGQSANMELVTRRRQLGGNGLIMAAALVALGLPTSYLGTVGQAAAQGAEAGGNSGALMRGVLPSELDEVFREFASRARVIPLAPPAHTSALEFRDGKLMLGNLRPLSEITWEHLMKHVGLQRLRALFDEAVLLALANWTMLPFLTDIWRHVTGEVLPGLSKKPRRFFVDLADPQKRPLGELKGAMEALAEMNRLVPVTLGLNRSEAIQVARAVGLGELAGDLPLAGLADLAERIREAAALDTVVIHPRHGAAAATVAGAKAWFEGPFTRSPLISTGAGDHFNAGFVVGQMLGTKLENCLCLGTGLSGHFVREAKSPAKEQLLMFLQELPLAE